MERVTDAMIEAGISAWEDPDGRTVQQQIERIYTAMHAVYLRQQADMERDE